MIDIGRDGIKVDDFNTIKTNLETKFREIYGNDINLDQNSPDGQRIGIYTKVFHDICQSLVYMYNNLDVDFADDKMLINWLKLNNITPKEATHSQLDFEVDSDRETELKSGFGIKDDNDNLWLTSSQYTLKKGKTNITLFCNSKGAIDTTESYLLTNNYSFIKDSQIKSVTKGVQEESLIDLKFRRNVSLENGSYSTIGVLYHSIYKLDNVTEVVIYENTNTERDEKLDLEGHSLWVIVKGGDVSEIGREIVHNKTAGTGLKGSIEHITWETININGENIKVKHLSRFDRAKETEVFLKVMVKRNNINIPINFEVIKEALVKSTLRIGESLVLSSLFCRLNGLSDYSFFSIEGRRKEIDYVSTEIIAKEDEILIIKTDNIEIQEMA